VLWVRALIDEALESYPFAAGERARVAVLGPDFQVAGARPLLVHVLYNLLKNALDAVRARERREIRLACEPGGETGGNWNRLTVADTGCGIPEEAMPHIFDDFFSLKGPGSGTGMGLPFCRRVMRGLGGEIVCRSRLGEYTRMELSFPPAGTDNRDPDALSEDQQ
jgi:signal transduction histidine kinase